MPSGNGPWPHDTPGARAFARAFISHYDDVAAEVQRQAAAHPVLSKLLASIPPEVLREEDRASRARLEQAFAGDWAAYAQPMRDQGALYAELGVRFADWYDLASAWSRTLMPVLVREHASDPALLADALESMHDFLSRAMVAVGGAYIQASADKLRQRHADLERWEAIFRHVAWGVAVTDDDGRIDVANPAFAAMCERELAGLVGTRVSDLVVDEDRGRVRTDVRAEAFREGRVSYETELRRADGSTFPVLIDAAQIPSGDPSSTRWVLNIHDLTDRKLADSLARRSVELEVENRRIQEASRLKSEFLANMSHELRTPLNSIIGFSELLHHGQVGTLAPKQHEFVGDILNSGRHLLRLINDVLDLSKVESGTMQFRPEPVSLEAIVHEVRGVLRAIAEERGIEVVSQIDPEIGEVQVDPGRLKQVLYNYLSNALKFSPEGGRVDVRVRGEDAASFRIEVQDRGAGIAREEQHRLFVEFEQLHGGRAKQHAGTGLGLALTRRLVEAQGGTVGVESELGAGATFHATLPRRAPRISLPQPRRIAGASERAPRILVVEDDASDQERIVAALVAAGYAVDTAATGAQARRACEERTYDAITLDLLLPDVGGLEILASVRGTSRHANVPVIVISVVSEQVTAGFVVHDVLPKPIREEALISSLARAGLVAPGAGPVLVVDDDEGSAKLVGEMLQQLGFRAVTASDGARALERARVERPCAVVLDLIMPGLDGFGFLDQFRAEPAWEGVPVFVWTVKDLAQEEHAALLQRAQAVLPKDGSGARGIVDTIRRHVPRVREDAR